MVQAIEDEEYCWFMQNEVRDIFDIKEEYTPQVIYFDQYYALEGRTTPEIEKYLLKKLVCICSNLDFAVNNYENQLVSYDKAILHKLCKKDIQHKDSILCSI